MSDFSVDYREHIGFNPEKMYKSTIFNGNHLMLGLNCLEPGQEHHLHTHSDQDKFYFVLEGEGEFTVADQNFIAGKGKLIWAAAGVPHAVKNRGEERLVILMGMAPGPNK